MLPVRLTVPPGYMHATVCRPHPRGNSAYDWQYVVWVDWATLLQQHA